MQVFQVRQTKANAVVWTGTADSESAALDAMAHAAGYRALDDLPEYLRSELKVETLRI